MTFIVQIEKPDPVPLPPDGVVIRSTDGHGTWRMPRPQAEILWRVLGNALGLQACMIDDSPGICCCKNCPWNGNHGDTG